MFFVVGTRESPATKLRVEDEPSLPHLFVATTRKAISFEVVACGYHARAAIDALRVAADAMPER